MRVLQLVIPLLLVVCCAAASDPQAQQILRGTAAAQEVGNGPAQAKQPFFRPGDTMIYISVKTNRKVHAEKDVVGGSLCGFTDEKGYAGP
jgi:hypothetical protein